jgi:hypothetical protein
LLEGAGLGVAVTAGLAVDWATVAVGVGGGRDALVDVVAGALAVDEVAVEVAVGAVLAIIAVVTGCGAVGAGTAAVGVGVTAMGGAG